MDSVTDQQVPSLTAHLGSQASTSVAPLTAHLTSQQPTSAEPHINADEIHLSRAQVPWTPEVWARIDRAVAHEVRRTRKATRILPQLRVGHHVTNVELDIVLQNLTPGSPPFVPPTSALQPGATAPTLNVYEGANLTVIELSVKHAMTHAQVRKELERTNGHQAHRNGSDHESSSTAVMLNRRCANILSLGVDALIWVGSHAVPAAGGAGGIPIFSSQTVIANGIPADTGLTCIGGPNSPLEVLPVEPANATQDGATTQAFYSTNTVAKISKAVTDLAASGYGGPYAAALPPYVYAESFFPLGITLQRPADLIIPLLDGGYHDSVMMPGVPNPVTPNPGGNPLGLTGLTNGSAQGVGIVLSLGGDVVEFVNGLDPVTAFSQIDGNGNFIFLLKTRVGLKISDSGGFVRLEFN